jgi:hypothetical protein
MGFVVNQSQATSHHDDKHWEHFKDQHKKTYETHEEETKRFVYLKNTIENKKSRKAIKF